MKAGTSTGLDADRGLNGIPPPLGWSSETARLLPHVFKGIDFAQKLYVLDVGSAQPKSIEFFSRFRCRLYVADLFDPSVLGRNVDSLSTFLEYAKNVYFDVCLLWDYLNYMDDAALKEFLSALSGHIHPNTRVFATAAYSTDYPLAAHQYAIIDFDRLAIRRVSTRLPHPRSQAEILKAMQYFKVHRAALRRDNRVELILKSSLKKASSE